MKKLIFLMAIFSLLFSSSSCEEKGEKLIVASELRMMSAGAGYYENYVVKRGDSNEWTFFYSNIEGFDYEPGYEYEIIVKVEDVENPPMDASSKRYTLLKVVSKEKKDSEGLPEGIKSPLENQEAIEKLIVASELRLMNGGVRYYENYVVKRGDSGPWTFFYNSIKDFDYEPGYEYEIIVKVEDVENPPMDASSKRYTLLKVVSKEKKNSEGLPENARRQYEE